MDDPYTLPKWLQPLGIIGCKLGAKQELVPSKNKNKKAKDKTTVEFDETMNE